VVGLSVCPGYEPALSSKQDLLSMRGVDISPQHKETGGWGNYLLKLSDKRDIFSNIYNKNSPSSLV
jgi:hypothetical protein